MMNEGKLYELQQDKTYSLYKVQYNPGADYKKSIFVDD